VKKKRGTTIVVVVAEIARDVDVVVVEIDVIVVIAAITEITEVLATIGLRTRMILMITARLSSSEEEMTRVSVKVRDDVVVGAVIDVTMMAIEAIEEIVEIDVSGVVEAIVVSAVSVSQDSANSVSR
jgi:hypothetical protein